MGCGLDFLVSYMAFGREISVALLISICILGNSGIRFGSICLDGFWIFSLGHYMDFIFFSFLSTQGTFDGDGHLLSVFDISLPFFFFGSLTSPFGGKGLPSTFCCTCGCSLFVTCTEF